MRMLLIFLMVVLTINFDDILALESKRDTPVTAYFNGPDPFAIAGQRMQNSDPVMPCLWDSSKHLTDLNQAQPFSMFGLNSRFDAPAKEPFQALMLEAYDYILSVTRAVVSKQP